MKHHRLAAAVAMAGLILAGCNAGETGAQLELKTQAQKASYAIGLNMGQSLDGLSDMDPKIVALGIEDAMSGKEPRLKEAEIAEVFDILRKSTEEQSAKLTAETSKAGQKYLDENAKREGVVTTASGLQYEVITKGDGPTPTANDVVSVHYEGRLVDGTVFDSSIQRGSPIDLPVNGVIAGWVEALQLMHVGEKVQLFVPSDLAYGEQSPSPAIPPNSVLVFDLELLGIKDAAATQAQP
mgnify:FL=1